MTRRFSIFDAMILVAATAVGLTLSRWVEAGRVARTPFPLGRFFDWIVLERWASLAFAWSLGLFLIALRPPRPRIARLARRPGFLASAVTVGTASAGFLLATAEVAIRRDPPGMSHHYAPGYYLGSAIAPVPYGIGGAWLALGLGRRWAPRRSWDDRVGRLLGGFWLVLWLTQSFETLVNYLASRFL